MSPITNQKMFGSVLVYFWSILVDFWSAISMTNWLNPIYTIECGENAIDISCTYRSTNIVILLCIRLCWWRTFISGYSTVKTSALRCSSEHEILVEYFVARWYHRWFLNGGQSAQQTKRITTKKFNFFSRDNFFLFWHVCYDVILSTLTWW